MLTISQAVREALKTVEDPEAADGKRLLTIARAKLHQSGNTKDEVKDHNVSQMRGKIRDAMGKPLTVQKVKDYEATLTGVCPSVSSTLKSTPAVLDVTPSLESLLQAAKEFIHKAGGIDKAESLIRILKEILP